MAAFRRIVRAIRSPFRRSLSPDRSLFTLCANVQCENVRIQSGESFLNQFRFRLVLPFERLVSLFDLRTVRPDCPMLTAFSVSFSSDRAFTSGIEGSINRHERTGFTGSQ